MRLAALVVLLAVLRSSAQETLVESIDVRVVNVDVVVTDREGRPVTGLTARDFEILEDKTSRAITNFYEVRDGAPVDAGPSSNAPPASPRSFILFVDNRAMHPAIRKHVTAELGKLIDSQMRDHDQASVISWDRVLKIEAPLTSDKAAIHAAIARVSATGSPSAARSEFARVQGYCTQALQMARSGRMPVKVAYEDCIGTARTETQRQLLFSRLILNALDVAMSAVAGVEGKKILVMAGTELPVKPGMEMYQWANSTFAPFLTGFDAALARPEDEERTQRDLLEKLGRRANAHGVTLYMISALMPTDTMSAASSTGIIDAGAEFLRSGNTEISHETLARLTGGVAAPIAHLAPMFDALASDLRSYYSLGYRPPGNVTGDRPITVRTRNRAHVVRARQSYAPRSADDQMADRVVANIFTPARESEWTIQLRTGQAQRVEKDRCSVPIEVIAPSTVTLLPRDNDLAGGFTVFIAVGNEQGALSTTFRQPNAIRLKAGEEAGFRKEPLVFSATLTLREGENLVSAGAVDQVSGTMGFARTTVSCEPRK